MPATSRRVSLAVCASQSESSVSGFIRYLEESFSDSVDKVEFIEIPYNDIDTFRFDRPVDTVILCHSIYNRRFSLTNVTDALYDKFLPMAKAVVGQGKVAVAVHDLPFPVSPQEKSQRMDLFRLRQPLTFSCSSFVFTCGKLGSGQTPEIDAKDRSSLEQFLRRAQSMPKVVASKWWKYPLLLALLAPLVLLGIVMYAILSSLSRLPSIHDNIANNSENLETEL